MFLFPVLYISNTSVSILADPSNADFWIKVIDVSTPIPFKLPFHRNGTVPKAPNTIGMTLVFTSHILLNSLARFWYFYYYYSYLFLLLFLLFLLLLLSSLIRLDSSVTFTISAGSNLGSGALMGSHGLHSIDRTFRRM